MTLKITHFAAQLQREQLESREKTQFLSISSLRPPLIFQHKTSPDVFGVAATVHRFKNLIQVIHVS